MRPLETRSTQVENLAMPLINKVEEAALAWCTDEAEQKEQEKKVDLKLMPELKEFIPCLKTKLHIEASQMVPNGLKCAR